MGLHHDRISYYLSNGASHTCVNPLWDRQQFLWTLIEIDFIFILLNLLFAPVSALPYTSQACKGALYISREL